jgi:L-fucose mutarotase/ribose pyranase (RbsD/FucU family)
MLKGISPYLSPDLLKTLAEMGHGDEIILADAHFYAAFWSSLERLDTGHEVAD